MPELSNRYSQYYQSPLGRMLLISDGGLLTGLYFDRQKYLPCFVPEPQAKTFQVFEAAKRWLDAYFSGEDPGFTPPLGLEGSPFRRAVWDVLLTIPFGKTITYTQIAERIARQMGIKRVSARAVGNAVAHNPISLIIPCHRVVGHKGSLTGYGGGIERKAWLLVMEGVDMQGLFILGKGTAL